MLKDKNAVITGARKGIGRATVEVFAQNGANVWACARTQDLAFEAEMMKLAEQYGVWIEPLYFDLTNESEMKAAVRAILAKKQNVDILVNNAGIAQYDAFAMLPFQHLENMLANNYIAPLRLTQMLSRRMREGGSIVFLSSVAGLRGESGNLAYGGSKAAIAHAVTVLSKELAGRGIRVNAVAPGMVNTGLKDKADKAYWERLIDQVYLKRMAEPKEIANVIAFLSGDMASYINGQIIRVDGGLQ